MSEHGRRQHAGARDEAIVQQPQSERDAGGGDRRAAGQHRDRENAIGDMRHRREPPGYFATGISVTFTQMSAPSSTGTSLPSGARPGASPSVRAAKPHQPARGIA